MYAEEQLATYEKKLKEFFDKNKATDRQISAGATVFVLQPKLKHPKQRRNY